MKNVELTVIEKDETDTIKIVLECAEDKYRDFVVFMKPNAKGAKARKINQQKKALMLTYKTSMMLKNFM